MTWERPKHQPLVMGSSLSMILNRTWAKLETQSTPRSSKWCLLLKSVQVWLFIECNDLCETNYLTGGISTQNTRNKKDCERYRPVKTDLHTSTRDSVADITLWSLKKQEGEAERHQEMVQKIWTLCSRWPGQGEYTQTHLAWKILQPKCHLLLKSVSPM